MVSTLKKQITALLREPFHQRDLFNNYIDAKLSKKGDFGKWFEVKTNYLSTNSGTMDWTFSMISGSNLAKYKVLALESCSNVNPVTFLKSAL